MLYLGVPTVRQTNFTSGVWLFQAFLAIFHSAASSPFLFPFCNACRQADRLPLSLPLCVGLAPHFHMKVYTGAQRSPECTDRPCAAPIQPSFPLRQRALAESIMFSALVQSRSTCCTQRSAFIRMRVSTNTHSWKIIHNLHPPTSIYRRSHTHCHHLSINGTALRGLIHLISNQLACYHQQ